jgi:ABC-type uncharacterized transport system permease subunit
VNLAAFWLVDVRGVVTFYVLAPTCSRLIIPARHPTWLATVAYATPFLSIRRLTDLVTGQAAGLDAGDRAGQAWATPRCCWGG